MIMHPFCFAFCQGWSFLLRLSCSCSPVRALVVFTKGHEEQQHHDHHHKHHKARQGAVEAGQQGKHSPSKEGKTTSPASIAPSPLNYPACSRAETSQAHHHQPMPRTMDAWTTTPRS